MRRETSDEDWLEFSIMNTVLTPALSLNYKFVNLDVAGNSGRDGHEVLLPGQSILNDKRVYAKMQTIVNIRWKKELRKRLISCHEIQRKECLWWKEQSSLSKVVKRPK